MQRFICSPKLNSGMVRTKVITDWGTLPRLLLLGLLAALPPAVSGQVPDSLPAAGRPVETFQPHVIRWWHGALALGGVSAVMLLDHPAQRFAQRNRGPGADNVA